MPVFTKDNKTVLFIHVPKAAGTTIEETLVAGGYGMTYRRGGKYGPLNDFDWANGCSPQHLHADLLEEHFGDTVFDLCFMVVRHPVQRFVSEYKFRVDSGHPLVSEGCIETFASRALEECERDPMILDNHVRPQTDFVWRDCKIVRLEDGLEQVSRLLSDLPGDRIDFTGQHRMVSRQRTDPELSPQLKARLHAFYERDFIRFGYD